MSSRYILQALLRRGFIEERTAEEAIRRQQLYGGGIDTVLLEMGAMEESTLLTQLSSIVGIPLAPFSLLDTFIPMNPAPLSLEFCQRLGIVPLVVRDDALHVAARPDHSHDDIVDWAAQDRVLIEPFLVSEPRFRALLGAVYKAPVAPRYATVLARLVGTRKARQALGYKPDTTPPPPPVDPVETLLEMARMGDDAGRLHALRKLAKNLHDPRVAAYRRALLRRASSPDPVAVTGALSALAELRDGQAVPAIIPLLESTIANVAEAAHTALRILTCEEVGTRSRRWKSWWEENGQRDRTEWLIQGLAHKEPEIRLLASQEMQLLSGEYFGYHFDLPEREREEARQRFMAWWQKAKGQGSPSARSVG